MKATFQSLTISLLLGLALVNASPIPQGAQMPTLSEICSALPAAIASTTPGCPGVPLLPPTQVPQKRQGLPNAEVLCQEISKTLTPLGGPCKQLVPPPPKNAGRRRQLPSEYCKSFPAPVATLLGCPPASPAPAAAARQLDAVTGLLGELGGLGGLSGPPVSAPAQPAAPAAAARQLDGLTSVIGSLSGELVPTTAPPKGAAAAKRQVPPAVGSILSGITSAVSGASAPKIPGLPAIPPATSAAPATSAPEARQLGDVTGILAGIGEFGGLVPSPPPPQGAAAAKRQEAPSPAQVVSQVCDPNGPLASFPPIAAICSTASSDPEAALSQLCQFVPLSICPAPDAEPAPPSTPAPDAAAEA